MTLLSICIPFAQERNGSHPTIGAMLQSPRTDFEIVIGTAGDDPEQSTHALSEWSDDPRLRIVAPSEGAKGPCDDWNHLLAHSRGKWITVIGAEDHADPDICEVLAATLKRVPDADALSWGRAEFIAPLARTGQTIARIPTGSKLLAPEQTEMMRRLFYWEGASDRPDCHFGVWHGAVRRDVLERIGEAFSGQVFEQSQPAIDNLCKVTMLAKRMVMWERPLSVQCVTAIETTKTSVPSAIDDAGWKAFPFDPDTGVAARIAVAIEAFKRRYGIELDGWQDGFIAACARDCETASSGETFHARKAAYEKAILQWSGKRALKTFKPEFRRKPKVPRFQGVKDGELHFDMEMDGTRDAAGFYRLINALSFPVHLLDYKLA
ncbi:glycosyltransferase [Hoeflea sp.]|uniref:glycosyltransferase n=1 Tax=Hoeflea sp. TaxID=1940281 RepID=UPI003BAFF51A